MCFQGKKSDFIEIPARWELDDYPHLFTAFNHLSLKDRIEFQATAVYYQTEARI